MAHSREAPVRFAVIGLGHIAQVAVLPAFHNAENAELSALVSGDDEKLRILGDRYDVEERLRYSDLEALLEDDLVDALYIALPNHLHHRFTLRAAEAGVHVLCEKPLAVTADQCREMIAACEANDVLLMTAYRLHFEAANLQTLQAAREGELGDLRFFQASFSQNVVGEDIRLNPLEEGGGTVYDMGIYCINAARYLFGDDPIEVMAMSERKQGDERFAECDEMTGALLRFPGERLATFTSSFGSYATSTYRLVGTEGEAVLDPAFGYATNLSFEHHLPEGQERSRTFDRRDQFAPQLIYFSECIQQGRVPQPDGYEGLADVQVIEAIYESARTGSAIEVAIEPPEQRPDAAQIITRPGFSKPEEFGASSPSE
jgi:predicted dehydrogenase